MGFSTVSSTACHHILPISPYAGAISIPRRKDPRRRRKARVLPRAAIVEARPQALPVIKEVNGGNNAVPFHQRGSSFRDRTGDMQAEARAMTRAANASVYSPELLVVKYGSRPVKVNDICTSDVTLIASTVFPYHPFIPTFLSVFLASPSCRFCGGLLKY